MIELLDTFPDVNVAAAEYKRLLGYPREQVLDGAGAGIGGLGAGLVREAWPAVGLCAARRIAENHQRIDFG